MVAMTTHEHSIWGFQITDSRSLRHEFRIGEHLKAGRRCIGKDAPEHISGTHWQGGTLDDNCVSVGYISNLPCCLLDIGNISGNPCTMTVSLGGSIHR